MGVNNRHGPHLALDKIYTLDLRVVEAIERDGVGSPWVVGGVFLLTDEVGPELAVAI